MKSEAVMQFKRKKESNPSPSPPLILLDLSAKGWHYWKLDKYKNYGHFHKNQVCLKSTILWQIYSHWRNNFFQCTQQFYLFDCHLIHGFWCENIFLREGSIQETYSKPWIFPKKMPWPPGWNLWNFEHMGFHFLTLNLSRIRRKKSHIPKSTVLYCFIAFSHSHILAIFWF